MKGRLACTAPANENKYISKMLFAYFYNLLSDIDCNFIDFTH